MGSILVYSALVVVLVSIATLLFAVEFITPTARASLLVISISAWIVVVALGWARGTLPLVPVLVAIGITLFGAVATPSHQSEDVYSYAMYGRIVTEHHHNPYATYPMHFEGDPMRRHVGPMAPWVFAAPAVSSFCQPAMSTPWITAVIAAPPPCCSGRVKSPKDPISSVGSPPNSTGRWNSGARNSFSVPCA